MTHLLKTFPALFALALSACGSVDLAGLNAARALDPLNTPPTDIAVAVGVPATLRLADGDAELRLAFRGVDAAAAVLVEEVAHLQLRAAAPGQPRPNAADERVYVARISPADADRMAAAQTRIKELKAQGVTGQGQLRVEVMGGCSTVPDIGPLVVSTWIETGAEDGFVTLTRRQDLSHVLEPAELARMRARLAPCAAAD